MEESKRLGDDVVTSFLYYDRKEIDNLYNTLHPSTSLEVSQTITSSAEGSIDLKIFPSSVGGKTAKTIEREYIPPTAGEKYAYCVRRLIDENSLVVISKDPIGPELLSFNNFVEQSKRYPELKIPSVDIEKQERKIREGTSLDVLLRNKLKSKAYINCFIQRELWFSPSENGDVILTSANDDSVEQDNIRVALSNEEMTRVGKRFFENLKEGRSDFTLLGKAKQVESRGGEFSIFITPYSIF